MDADNSGSLERPEMKILLTRSGEEVTKELIDEIFSMLDQDGSGSIDLAEFLKSLEWYI